MARSLDRKDALVWRRVRGMNDWDAPDDLPDDIGTLVVNVQYHRGGLGTKRAGSVAQVLGGDPFVGYTYLANFVPAGGDPNAELFIVSGEGPKRLFISRGGATALLLTADTVTGGEQFHTATLNNKLFIAYPSGLNVLHVYEAGGLVVRRTGLPTPFPPGAADQGVGTYPNSFRYYRIQWRFYAGTDLQRASALGPPTGWTPSGTAAAVRVTRPVVSGAGETHWALYVSADNATYYHLATLPIATTFYDDSAPYGLWSGELGPLEGANTNWPSVKYLCSTGDRLLGFGVHTNSGTGDAMVPFPGRVYFSPVINTTDADDEERVSNTLQNKGYIDIARNAGAVDRGISQAIDNQIMVAQARGLWLLIPTGLDTGPYRRVALSPSLGWVSQWSTVSAEDESGRPCLYFLDPVRGPYRYGASGLQWCGYDIQSTWARFNKNAPDWASHGVYDHQTRDVRWWIPVDGAATGPNYCLNFNVREGQSSEHGDVRGGWSTFIGTPYTTPTTSVMFSRTLLAVRSAVWQPYLGFQVPASLLLRTNEPGLSRDNGTPYRAYLVSRAWRIPPEQHIKQIVRAWLNAAAADGVSITLTTIRNYGDERRSSAVSLTPNPASTGPGTPEQRRVQRRFDDASLVDAWAFQLEIGDIVDFAASSGWVLDQFLATIEYGAET